jgi:hypothetical protein
MKVERSLEAWCSCKVFMKSITWFRGYCGVGTVICHFLQDYGSIQMMYLATGYNLNIWRLKIQNCNFVWFVWVWNLVPHFKVRTQIECVWEQGSEENMWVWEGWSGTRVKKIVRGYSKRSIHFQKFILQVLLNIWWRAIYRLKGELSKLFSHLTSTRCEPHVADVKSIIQLFPHSLQHVTGNSSHSLSDAWLQIIDIRTLRDFLSIHTQDMDLASVLVK